MISLNFLLSVWSVIAFFMFMKLMEHALRERKFRKQFRKRPVVFIALHFFTALCWPWHALKWIWVTR